MTRKVVCGSVVSIFLCSIVVFGMSSTSVRQWIGSVQKGLTNGSINPFDGPQYVDRENLLDLSSKIPSSFYTGQGVNLKSTEIPDEILWRVMLTLPDKFEIAAQNARAAGQSDSMFTDYFIRVAKMSAKDAEMLKQKAAACNTELKPLLERMQAIETKQKEARDRGQKPRRDEIYSLRTEFAGLQEQRKAITLKYRDEFRKSIDADSFTKFENWLRTEFAAKFSSRKITSKDTPLKLAPSVTSPNDGFKQLEREGNEK